MKNKNLNDAKINKYDEFYTQLSDIQKELLNYGRHFENKIIYCNCDKYDESNFVKYFIENFKKLKLKKLIATNFEFENCGNKFEMFLNDKNEIVENFSKLNDNGDFRSEECLEILRESNIVVTNPPFSLFREFVGLLFKFEKDFLIIGNQNAIHYKNIFEKIINNKIYLGLNKVTKFFSKNRNQIINIGGVCWFTTFEILQREKFETNKKYFGNENLYPKLDNYDMINISKTKDIPMDYTDFMAVPITYLFKHNYTQFKLFGVTDRVNTYKFKVKIYTKEDSPRFRDFNGCPILKMGDVYKLLYDRLIIKKIC